MPSSAVIADVSATLRVALNNALSTLQPPATAEVHDLLGNIPTSPARLTLFLFEIVEDASQRNRPPVRGVAPPDLTSRKPPMALLLRYLLTPWSSDPATDQLILGRALQVLYDDAILSGSQLQGGIAGTGEALKLKLAPISLEERTRVWHAVNKPYRLSVTFEVRVVNLDAINTTTTSPVQSRRVDPSMAVGA